MLNRAGHRGKERLIGLVVAVAQQTGNYTYALRTKLDKTFKVMKRDRGL